MNFKKYQAKTNETAVYPKCYAATSQGDVLETSWMYCALGLAGEVGEIEEKLKKILRDKDCVMDSTDKTLLAKEVGDVLYYLAQLCEQLGVSLQDCAEGNITKLADRKARGVLKGSGDNR